MLRADMHGESTGGRPKEDSRSESALASLAHGRRPTSGDPATLCKLHATRPGRTAPSREAEVECSVLQAMHGRILEPRQDPP